MGPQSRVNGASGKDGPISCLMGELNAFVVGGKHNRMVANNIAASEHRKSDITSFPLPGEAIPAPVRDFAQIDTPPFGRGLPKCQCGARRCIYFVAVMHLDNFNIEIRVENLGHLPRELNQ